MNISLGTGDWGLGEKGKREKGKKGKRERGKRERVNFDLLPSAFCLLPFFTPLWENLKL